MDIIINQQKIDYKLEGEKTIRDIIGELERWIRDGDYIIQQVRVDKNTLDLEKNFSNEDSDFLEKSPADINCIEIIAKPRFEMAYSALINIHEYIKSLLGLNERFGNVDDYDELLDGIELIYEGLDRALGILQLKPETIFNSDGKSLKEIIELLHSLIINYRRRFFDENGVRSLKNILENLDGLFSDILKLSIYENRNLFSSLDINNAGELIKLELRNLSILINKTVDLINKSLENLQVGNDYEGFRNISTVMEYISYTISGTERVIFDLDRVHKIDIISDIKEKQRKLFSGISELLQRIESFFNNMNIMGMIEIMDSKLKNFILDLGELLRSIEKIV